MQKVKFAKISNNYIQVQIWKRFLAYLIDFILVNLIVSLPFKNQLGRLNNFNFLLSGTDKNLMLVSIFIIFSLIFYFTILEFKLGQTLGKMIFGIYVISIDRKNLTLSQAFVRNITKPFPIVLLVDVIYMFFKQGNQRLFEVFSGTTVIEKELSVR